MGGDLSGRLSAALDLLRPASVVFDVGADKGLLVSALLAQGKKAYGGENKKGPFEGLQENLGREGRRGLAFLQDGMVPLPKDVDTVSILGMGGKTMRGILERGRAYFGQVRFFVVSPQSAFEEPIGYLLQNGYENDAGGYVFEKRYYPLLRFAKTDERKEYAPAELCFGPYPIRKKDRLLLSHVERELGLLLSLPLAVQEERKDRIFFLQGVRRLLS